MSLNIPLYEIYGMSECSGPATISYFGHYKMGRTGRAMTHSEVKIANDGEILIRGKHVFKGYLHNEEATKETLDQDGWLHTGDLGEFDNDGFLAITGRKKNIIITAGGENIAPEMLEKKLKSIPEIEHAVVVGDNKKYLSALITTSELAMSVAKELGSKANNKIELSQCEKFQTYIKNKIREINQSLARVQTVKTFAILPYDFTEEGGELTPTMKVKRPVVLQKYKNEISSLY